MKIRNILVKLFVVCCLAEDGRVERERERETRGRPLVAVEVSASAVTYNVRGDDC